MRNGLFAGVAVALATCAGATAVDGGPPVLALVPGPGEARLVAYDAATLARRGPDLTVPNPAYGVEWARSPDASMTALVPKASERDERLFVVATSGRLRLVSTASLAGEDVCRLAWPTRRRVLLVLTRGPACYAPIARARVVVIDPVTGRRQSQRGLLGNAVVVATASTRRALLLLVRERSARAYALLVVTETRTDRISLRGVSGPTLPLAKGSGSSIGLAVDESGRHAHVVEPSGRMTDVELATRTARTRAVGALRPAAAAKGPTRALVQAVSVGRGLVAVTGLERSADGTPAPRGLFLVDTQTWRIRAVDPAVSRVTYAGGTILAYQPAPFTGRAGIGLRGYTAGGALRFEAMRGDRVEVVRTQGDHAYVAATGGSAIVDLRTGGVRPAPAGMPLPYALLAAD